MLSGMARPAFTLAALATAALPGLEVAASQIRTTGLGHNFDSAEIVSTDGAHYLIRVPRTQAAETDQSADLIALRALSEGVRQRLPFLLPRYLGQAPIGPTRGIVYDFIPGTALTADALTSEPTRAASVGRAIAAIHSLPTSVVIEAGLATHTAAEARTATVELITRAAATGHVPAALVTRWEEAADEDNLWQFVPTVINGELAADSFLILDQNVNGILGWASLSVGDPARDLFWLFAARGEFAELGLSSYLAARGGTSEPHLARRSALYGELELARWLLHGVESRKSEIIDDAVNLLDALVARVHSDSVESLAPHTGPIMTVSEVENLLEETPIFATMEQPTFALTTDSYDRSEFERAAAGEEVRDAEMQSAWEPEPVAMDLSDYVGAPVVESNPDHEETEPITLPHNDRNSSSL